MSNNSYPQDSNYAHAQIHLEMLQDEERTMSYADAIERNPSLFAGKVILDVGCGTGILSLFAAQAGARKVYAVECTPISAIAEQIVKDNHFENVITIIRGKMSEAEIPEKVDLIVSEWMGYGLHYELMLPAILEARDQYLKRDGVLFPSSASIYLAAAESAEYRAESIDYWANAYGFDFSAMRSHALLEPVTDQCQSSQIITSIARVSSINIKTCSVADIFFTSDFSLKSKSENEIDAFVIWFDVAFEGPESKNVLSTSPMKPPTHWRQLFLYLSKPIPIAKGDIVAGKITYIKHPSSESGIQIGLEFGVGSGEVRHQLFDLP